LAASFLSSSVLDAVPASAEARADAVSPDSVYQLRPVADGLVLALASGTALLAGHFASTYDDRHCPCDRAGVNSFERGVVGNSSKLAGRISDVTLLLAVTVPAALDAGLLGWNRALLEDLVVFAEALAVNWALVSTTKWLVHRPRPLAYVATTDGSEVDLYLSFYSGHTSWTFTALAAATYTSYARYDVLAVPAIISGLVGASVAAERVAAGKHFYSDVVVGALAGTAVGLGIPWLHRRRRAGPALLVTPTAGRGVALTAVSAF
jgi:membrane-associated phospholipid phosphatase